MKKIIAVFLTLVLIASLSTVAFASSNLKISVDSKTIEAGETVDIPVRLTENSGFMYMKLRVTYNAENFELIDVSNGSVTTGSFSKEGNAVLWDSSSNETGTGVLATITIKAKSDATADAYSVGVTFIEAWNENEDNLTADITNGTLTVPGSSTPDPEPAGDYNKDVNATYQEGTPADIVYSVDITWGSMEFTYTGAGEGTWNPSTHTFSGGAPAGWSCETDADKITVANHSNAVVNATLAYTAKTGYSAISGSFSETSGTANDNVISLASAVGTTVSNAPTDFAKLALSGTLSQGVSDQVIGSVTITLD